MDGITQNESVLAIEDYVVFTGLLAFSTCIGLFFAYFDSKKDDEDYDDESAYLVGNRSVSKKNHQFLSKIFCGVLITLFSYQPGQWRYH